MKEHSEYLYEFGINGYVILPSVLRDNEIQNFLDYWSSNLFEHPVHDVNFNWGGRMVSIDRLRAGLRIPLCSV